MESKKLYNRIKQVIQHNQDIQEQDLKHDIQQINDVQMFSMPDEQGMTLMHYAAEKGNNGNIAWLAQHLNIPFSAKDERNGTALLEAAASGHVETVSFLAKQGVDINLPDQRGDTAMHLAAGYGHVNILKWLIGHNAEIDPRTTSGVTPLLYATAKGRLDVMKLLVQHGADIHAIDDGQGWAAIHTAAGCDQKDAIHFLVSLDESLLNSKSRDGKTAESIALQEKRIQAYSAFIEISKSAEKRERKELLQRRRHMQAEKESKQHKNNEKEIELLLNELESPNTKKTKRKSKKKKTKPQLDSTCCSINVETTNTTSTIEEQTKDTCTNKELEKNDSLQTQMEQISEKHVCNNDQERIPFKMEQEENADDQGEWQVTISRRLKREQRKKAIQLEKKQRRNAKKSKKKEKTTKPSTPQQPRENTTATSIVGSTDVEKKQVVIPKRDVSRWGNTATLVTNSTLRPHAPPWSPRMAKTKSSKLAQTKLQKQNEQPERLEDVFAKASDSPVDSKQAVESEFNRMLKKFVHMDAGARRAARQRFAKAAREHEENRRAKAYAIEINWRKSVKSRLETAIAAHDVEMLRDVLEEVEATQEARTLHAEFESKTEPQPLKMEETDDSEAFELEKDVELKAFLSSARKHLHQLTTPILPSKTMDKQNTICLDLHSTCKTVPDDTFCEQLNQSIVAWAFQQKKTLKIKIPLERSGLIPKLVNQFGFDFCQAESGWVELIGKLSSSPICKPNTTKKMSKHSQTTSVVGALVVRFATEDGNEAKQHDSGQFEVLLKREQSQVWNLPSKRKRNDESMETLSKHLSSEFSWLNTTEQTNSPICLFKTTPTHQNKEHHFTCVYFASKSSAIKHKSYKWFSVEQVTKDANIGKLAKLACSFLLVDNFHAVQPYKKYGYPTNHSVVPLLKNLQSSCSRPHGQFPPAC